MINKQRVAIIGAGMMGVQHTEALRRIPGIEVIALADKNRQLAEKCCESMAIPACYDDYIEMIEKEAPDAVHVCTPNFTHYMICKDVIEKKINVFCEKPLANTAQEAQELAELAEKNGVVCGVNFNYRHNAIVREMHERVAKSDWGSTFLVRGEYLQDWMLYDTDYNWRCVPELGGMSRTVSDIGSHCFDTVQYVLGKKIKKVFANLLTVYPQRKKFTNQASTFGKQTGTEFETVDISSEDAGLIVAEFEDGMKGVFMLSQVSAGYKNGLKLSIDGSKYSMCWDQENVDKLVLGHREGGKEILYASAGSMTGAANDDISLAAGHSVGWADALKNSFNNYYKFIREGGKKKFTDFSDGMQIVRIVEACMKSSETGQWVEV